MLPFPAASLSPNSQRQGRRRDCLFRGAEVFGSRSRPVASTFPAFRLTLRAQKELRAKIRAHNDLHQQLQCYGAACWSQISRAQWVAWSIGGMRKACAWPGKGSRPARRVLLPYVLSSRLRGNFAYRPVDAVLTQLGTHHNWVHSAVALRSRRRKCR